MKIRLAFIAILSPVFGVSDSYLFCFCPDRGGS
jgi:hypothetical protein